MLKIHKRKGLREFLLKAHGLAWKPAPTENMPKGGLENQYFGMVSLLFGLFWFFKMIGNDRNRQKWGIKQGIDYLW